MADYPREPRNYELMVILLPELADEALTGAIDRVNGYVTSVGAEVREVLQSSPWGRRRLAYTIRFNGTDYRDGYYAIWHFSSIPSALGDLERDLKLDTSVIRHLLVIEDPKWGSPQERDAAREAANAPAETEGGATDAEGTGTTVAAPSVVANADVVAEAGDVEATETPANSAPEAEVAEAPAEVDQTVPADETVDAVETVPAESGDEQAEVATATDAAPVEDATDVVPPAETEATEDDK